MVLCYTIQQYNYCREKHWLSVSALFSNIVLWILVDSWCTSHFTALNISFSLSQKYSVIVTKYVSLFRQILRFFVSSFLAFWTQWCFLHFNFCVFPRPLRGSWRSSWGFLWLLCRTLPWRYLCGDITKEDLILCSQPPHPLCAPLLNDPVGLPAPCQLWGEDQPWWGIIRSVRTTGGLSIR